MKKPQQQRAVETRGRILDAAEALFDERGYAKTSMNVLADRADVSIGGLYEWFPNKDAIVTAVAERHLEQVGDTILEQLASANTDDLESLISMVLETALAAHQARPKLHQFLYTEAPRPPELQKKLKAFDDAIENALAANLKERVWRPQEAVLQAALIARAGQALLHEFVLDGDLPGTPKSRLRRVVASLVALAGKSS